VQKESEFFLPTKVEEKDSRISKIKKVQFTNELTVPEEVKTKHELQLEEERLPLSVRERRQTVKVYEVFKDKAKWGEFYRVYGMCLLLIGGYFLTVPFYNVVC
jgi:hypothetical protein